MHILSEVKKFAYLLLLLFVWDNAFANAKDVLPEVKVTVSTNLGKVGDPKNPYLIHSSGGYIENPRMLDSNLPMSFGLSTHSSVITYLHGENDGPPGANDLSETLIDFYHDSQEPDQSTTYCILDVQLDANTSELKSVKWLRRIPDQPDPSVNPAQCNFTQSGQNLNISISNQ